MQQSRKKKNAMIDRQRELKSNQIKILNKAFGTNTPGASNQTTTIDTPSYHHHQSNSRSIRNHASGSGTQGGMNLGVG
jgi:hypothetical protein